MSDEGLKIADLETFESRFAKLKNTLGSLTPPQLLEPSQPEINTDFIKSIPYDEYFRSLEERIISVEGTIKEVTKRNWVERNPGLFMFYSVVLSAVISAVITIMVSRLLQ